MARGRAELARREPPAQQAPLAYRLPGLVQLGIVSRSRRVQLMASGELASVTVGRSRLVLHTDLVEFLQTRPRRSLAEQAGAGNANCRARKAAKQQAAS
jgi:hypothetical protein